MIYAPKTLSKNTINTWLEADSLIRKGLYEQADKIIEELLAKNFSEIENHEFLLMQGKVKGYLLQHELAKNLLFTAFEFFKSQDNKEKTIECLNHLAITCLRKGEIKEAKTFLKAVSPAKDDFSLVVVQMVLVATSDYESVTQLKLPENTDSYITANFHNNLAVAYRKINKIDLAIENYQIAYDFFVLCEHFAYSGSVQNNLAFLYKTQNNFTQAHIYVDKALLIFQKYENQARYASALDTKANIYFAEKRYEQALEFINQSIEILNTHRNNFYLLESYETKIKISFALNDYLTAAKVFATASHLAHTYCGEEWTEKLVKRVADSIPTFDDLPKGVYSEEKLSKLEKYKNSNLVFPANYKSNYRYYIVETTNNCLHESFGISKNSTLIVADIAVNTGDLIAVLIKEARTVKFGVLQNEFDVSAIEIPNYSMTVLDERHQILGKVIGKGNVEDEKIMVNII